MLIKNFKRKKK